MTKAIKRQWEPKPCPICGESYKNVKNHILLKHQTGSAPQLNENKTPVELTKDDLLGRKQPEETNFTCNNCGAELKAGENPCRNCGAPLDWSGLV